MRGGTRHRVIRLGTFRSCKRLPAQGQTYRGDSDRGGCTLFYTVQNSVHHAVRKFLPLRRLAADV